MARLWTGVWATLSGQNIPDHLPPEAEEILRALTWNRSAGRNRPEHWFTTLRDAANPGPIREDIRAAVQNLAARVTTMSL